MKMITHIHDDCDGNRLTDYLVKLPKDYKDVVESVDFFETKRGEIAVELSQDAWALICDAIEIAIGESDYNDVKLDKDDRFWGMEEIMRAIVKTIEEQSGCQTKDD